MKVYGEWTLNPHILNTGKKWKWGISRTHRQFNPRYQRLWRRQNVLARQRIEPRFLGSAISVAARPSTHSRLNFLRREANRIVVIWEKFKYELQILTRSIFASRTASECFTKSVIKPLSWTRNYQGAIFSSLRPASAPCLSHMKPKRSHSIQGSVLISFPDPCLPFPTGVFPSGVSTKIYAFIIPPCVLLWSADRNDQRTVTQRYGVLSPTSYRLQFSPQHHILIYIHILHICDVALHTLKDQVSHPHTTVRSVAILYIMINTAAYKNSWSTN